MMGCHDRALSRVTCHAHHVTTCSSLLLTSSRDQSSEPGQISGEICGPPEVLKHSSRTHNFTKDQIQKKEFRKGDKNEIYLILWLLCNQGCKEILGKDWTWLLHKLCGYLNIKAWLVPGRVWVWVSIYDGGSDTIYIRLGAGCLGRPGCSLPVSEQILVTTRHKISLSGQGSGETLSRCTKHTSEHHSTIFIHCTRNQCVTRL